MTIYGLPGMEGRVPTFLVNVEGVPAADVAAHLAALDIGVWAHDSWYSLDLYKRLGYDEQAIRIGFIHYNTRRRGRPARGGVGERALGLSELSRRALALGVEQLHEPAARLPQRGSWRWAISLPSTCTGVPCVPTVCSPSARATIA